MKIGTHDQKSLGVKMSSQVAETMSFHESNMYLYRGLGLAAKRYEDRFRSVAGKIILPTGPIWRFKGATFLCLSCCTEDTLTFSFVTKLLRRLEHSTCSFFQPLSNPCLKTGSDNQSCAQGHEIESWLFQAEMLGSRFKGFHCLLSSTL